jgi:hypothetical protein
MLELFETNQPKYDIWDYQNMPTFQIFIDNFEGKAQALETKVD